MYTPNCDVFWVGSYPLKDPVAACRRILKAPDALLHWPQLPKRSNRERSIDQTYIALTSYRPGKAAEFPKGTAVGWNAMWRLLKARPKTWLKHTHFKTQIAGPITLFGKLLASDFGSRTKQENEKLLLQYISLWLKHAYWQIDAIQERGFKPIIMLDEPLLPTYMGQAGSAQAKKTLKLLRSLVKRLKTRGAKVGIHCCNRISPSTLIDLEVDLVHFDVYHFPTLFRAAREDLKDFLKQGGIVAWGIVPANEALGSAGQAKLEQTFNDVLSSMESRGLPLRRVLAQSMVSPTCGTGLLAASEGLRVADFTARLSRGLKTRYGL